MRKTSGGVWRLAEKIIDDMDERETGLSKPQLVGLADITASVLATRSVNTSELAMVLPRTCANVEDRYRYINRWLANTRINPDQVMIAYSEELFAMALNQETTIVLMLDQSKIGKDFECLMLSVRFGERAIPLAWRVKRTKGTIGFETQEELLTKVFALLPQGLKIVLMGDRFYGTSALISLCQRFGWGYRLRLKGNLHLYDETEGLITPLEAHKLKIRSLENVCLGEDGPKTNIGLLQETGHPEPWFIAMNTRPTEARTLDYGMRWGIEALFSDLKSRGFYITQTQLRHEDRIERLLLVLTIALYWAVSTGMGLEKHKREKPIRKTSKKKLKDL